MEGYDRVTVVKFRLNYGGGNGASCFEVKVRADTAKFTDVILTRLRKCSNLIQEGKVLVENETNIVSGVYSQLVPKVNSYQVDSYPRLTGTQMFFLNAIYSVKKTEI